MINAEEIIRRYSRTDLRATPGYQTNFLGTLIDPKFGPGAIDGKAGTIEAVPIPQNWHPDIAEWAAALRAVDLAKGTFRMVELCCGWVLDEQHRIGSKTTRPCG